MMLRLRLAIRAVITHPGHVDCWTQAHLRRAAPLLPIACAIAPALATAQPQRPPSEEVLREELLRRLVERERSPFSSAARRQAMFAGGVSRSVLRPPALASAVSALDAVHAAHDITLDPASGETQATLELRAKAVGKPLSAIQFSFDEGLEIGKVSASDRATSVADAVFAPTRAVHVTLDPPLPAGEETIVTLEYAG
ncbi:MAG TPA: hypothetical protein VM925_13800, partial [Labilithrix sp.]|nr:hypothetical protein [Labilithrix sp.]